MDQKPLRRLVRRKQAQEFVGGHRDHRRHVHLHEPWPGPHGRGRRDILDRACASSGRIKKLYLERENGQLYVKQRVKHRLDPGYTIFRTLRTVKDTPKNHKDILRWADVMGHTIEKK